MNEQTPPQGNIVKRKLQHVLDFAREHWPLALVGAIIAFVFLRMHYFAELAYAAIRLIAVLFSAALVIHLVFKQTLRRYINQGQLVEDFHALDAKHKVYITLGVIIAVFIVSALCFVHP